MVSQCWNEKHSLYSRRLLKTGLPTLNSQSQYQVRPPFALITAEHVCPNDTCVKVAQIDNPRLHEIATKLLQICWLRKAADADDETSTTSHPTHVQHFHPGDNDFKQTTNWELLILHLGWQRHHLTMLDGDSPATSGVDLHTGSTGANAVSLQMAVTSFGTSCT